jgi:hypothetical protein
VTHRPTLATSLSLRDWLRRDPAWREQPRAWRAQQAWLATLGSLNARLSSVTEAQTAPVMLHAPVFIVGPWRSGTTVMHELLTAATGCPTPRTWQCMDPCAFRLPRLERKAAAIARPMDGLEIRDDSPQEDEFALLALGVESTYRAFWMPHRLAGLHCTLDPAHWLAHAQWLAPWEAFLRGVLAASSSDGTQPLILKSPNHTYRIASIVRRFPDARFVWMLRDPTQVFFSNRKMWSSMFATHGLTAARPDVLDDFLVHALRNAALVLRGALEGGPDERWAFVSHDALLAQPDRVVNAVVERLQLPRASQPTALSVALDRVRHGRVERHEQPMPPEVDSACAELAAVHRDALAGVHAIR